MSLQKNIHRNCITGHGFTHNFPPPKSWRVMVETWLVCSTEFLWGIVNLRVWFQRQLDSSKWRLLLKAAVGALACVLLPVLAQEPFAADHLVDTVNSSVRGVLRWISAQSRTIGSPGNMVRVHKRRECSFKLILSHFDITIGHKNEGLGLQIKCGILRVSVKPPMRMKAWNWFDMLQSSALHTEHPATAASGLGPVLTLILYWDKGRHGILSEMLKYEPGWALIKCTEVVTWVCAAACWYCWWNSCTGTMNRHKWQAYLERVKESYPRFLHYVIHSQ